MPDLEIVLDSDLAVMFMNERSPLLPPPGRPRPGSEREMRGSERLASEYRVAELGMAYGDTCRGATSGGDESEGRIGWVGGVLGWVRAAVLCCGGVLFRCFVCDGCYGYARCDEFDALRLG